MRKNIIQMNEELQEFTDLRPPVDGPSGDQDFLNVVAIDENVDPNQIQVTQDPSKEDQI